MFRQSLLLISGRATGLISMNNLNQSQRGIEQFWQPVKGSIAQAEKVGRPWTARELRGKSWEDLQKLWVVLHREKNRLMTERQAFRLNSQPWPVPSRLWKVKKSMARLKQVVGERSRYHQGEVPDNQYERSRLYQDRTFYSTPTELTPR